MIPRIITVVAAAFAGRPFASGPFASRRFIGPAGAGRCLLGLLLLGCAAAGLARTAPAPPPPYALTAAEKQWLAAHVARVGVVPEERLPFEAWQDGRAEGMAPDYMRLLAAKVGLRLEFAPIPDWVGSGSGSAPGGHLPGFDVGLTQALTPELSSRFHTLSPFTAIRPAIVVREQQVTLAADRVLAGRRIAALDTYPPFLAEITAHYPQATVVPVSHARDGLDALAQGRVDVYFSLSRSRADWLVRRRSDADRLRVIPTPTIAADISPVVSHQQPLLFSILRKAEAQVSADEMARLRARWNAFEDASAPTTAASLDAAERRQVAEQAPLRMAFEARRFPYSYVNERGELDGLVSEYVERLRGSLGLRIEPIPARNWHDLERMVRSGEVDMVAASVDGDIDARLLRVSRPYERFPEVIVTHASTDIHGPDDLAGRRVAARDEAGLLRQLRQRLPRATLIAVGSNEEGLRLLDRNGADAFIGTLPALDPMIREHYAGLLKVVGPVGVERELAFGLRAGRADLLPLINRVLTDISERDRQQIRARWLTAEYRYGVDWAWVLGIVFGSLAIIGTLATVSLRLRRESAARRHAESRLQKQLRFQQRLLETIPYPIFVKDSQCRYVTVNPAYESSYGVRAEDLVGRTIHQTRHIRGAEIDAMHELEMQVVTQQDRMSMEVRADTLYGEQRALMWLGGIPLEQDEDNGLLGTIVDVTEISLAEERARAAEQRLADITASLPATVFQVQADAEGYRRFTYMAGDTEGTFGMSTDLLLADPAAAYARVYPQDWPLLKAMHAQVIATLRPVPQFDVRVITPNGVRWMRTAGGQPRRKDDGTVEWSGYLIDIDETHQQSLALIDAKARADAASAAKSAFLAMMSHEIRTPMAGVIGLIELMQATHTDAEQREMLDMMQSSAGALLQILDDILDYSRIESGQLVLEKAPLDPRTLVDSVVGLFTANAWDKDLRVQVAVDWRIAPLLEGDPTRVRQVIGNLLSNAIKFTERGHVSVHADLLGESERGQRIRFRVADTGIGISAERMQEVFQPFVQAEASTTRRFGGTGLGLAICRKLAEMMSADLRLQPRAGGGTEAVFELTLPVSAAPGRRGQSLFAGRMAQLAIADPALRRGLSYGLSALGFNVVESPPDADGTDGEDGGDHDALWLVDAADAARTAGRPHRILVTDASDPRGYRLAPEGVFLRGNAMLHASLRAACRAAYHLAETHPRASATARRSDYTHLRLLVAEDNTANRIVLARQLKRLGVPHEVVEDGVQALEALERQPYDLLITDCHMPRMDGFELTRRLRERERGSGGHLPIIALTASTMPEEVERCLASGMDEVIAKPVQMATLEARIARALLGRDEEDDAGGRHSGTHSDTHAGTSVVTDDTGGKAAGDLAPSLDLLRETFGDDEPMRALLDHLLVDLGGGADALEQALEHGDHPAAGALRHRLKGTLALLMLSDAGDDHPLEPAELRARIRQIRELRRRLG